MPFVTKTINRNGLVGEWLLDGSGDDTNDGTKNNASMQNVTYANTDIGMQYKYGVFNGSSSKGSAGYSNVNFERTNSFSIFGWVYANSLSADGMIICQQASASTYQGWNLRVNSSGQLLCNLTSNYSTNNYLEARATATLTTGKWYLVGYTYSGNSNTSGINFYIDGQQSATISNFNSLSSSIQNTNNVTIGNRNSEGVYFNGNIQGLRVFNRALSQDEIYTLYLEGKKKLSGTSYSGLMDGLVAQFESYGDTALYNVTSGTTTTRTAGTATTDNFGAPRALTNPNYSWTSITYTTGYTWENSGSGWGLVTSPAGLSATGINRTTTLKSIYLFNRTLSASEVTQLGQLCALQPNLYPF